MGSDSDNDHQTSFRARHTCTDIPCAVLFLATVAATGFLVKYADDNSDLMRLSQGIDRNNKICGYQSEFPGSKDPEKGIPDKPFMFFCAEYYEASTKTLTVNYNDPVCVASCPTGVQDDNTNITAALGVPECYPSEVVGYASKAIQGRFCMPDNDIYAQVAAGAVEQEASKHAEKFEEASAMWEKLANDQFGLKHGKTVLLVCFVVALIGGYVYLFMLRLFAKCLVWVMVIGSVVIQVALGFFLWSQRGDGSIEAAAVAEGATQEDGGANDQYFKIGAIACWIGAAAVVIAMACLHSAIKTSIACIECGAKVIFKMPCLLLAPFGKALMKVTLWLLILAGALHIAALGTVNGIGWMRTIDYTTQEKQMIVFYMFGSFWILEFMNALYQFSIAYAVGFYYFAEPDEDDNREVPCTVLQEGVFVGLFKHMGSLAYGSCIIAIIQTIQWLLRYLAAKNEQGGANPVLGCILKVFMCCCKCLEGIMGFINKNVYIDIAITGDHTFCSGLLNVVKTILDYGSAMAILGAANLLFKVSGIAILTGGCGAIAWLMLQADKYVAADSETRVEGKEFVIGMSMLVAFTIAWAFMEVFGMTTDTLLYCFAVDKSANDGHVTTAPADFLTLYNDAEEIMHKRAKKREKLLKKRGSQ
mmetsp:Transcript_32558/g.96698  ORF Transcript_32558/g.96698 Transcript_32558/m.96698 type:complete len:645 (+) Transcript_32558:85-2019(+)